MSSHDIGVASLLEVGCVVYEKVPDLSNVDPKGGVIVASWVVPNEDGEPVKTFRVFDPWASSWNSGVRFRTMSIDNINVDACKVADPAALKRWVRRLAGHVSHVNATRLRDPKQEFVFEHAEALDAAHALRGVLMPRLI